MTLPASDTIEHLDFEHVPVCEVVVSWGISLPFHRFAAFGGKRCRKKAEWFLICGWCGAQTYACTEHYKTPYIIGCNNCQRRLGDKARWVRI